jgi:transposase-like protein
MRRPRLSASEKWRLIVARQAASGLSVAQFCRRYTVAGSSFFAWKRRLGQTGPQTQEADRRFVQATVSHAADAALPAGEPGTADEPGEPDDRRDGEAARAGGGILRLRLRGGRVLGLRGGIDMALLARVVRTLEALA